MPYKLKNEIKNIKRFKEILVVLFENGFGYLIDKVGLKKLIPLKSKLKPRFKILKPEQRLRITLEKLGPTFIKFGQLLSLRPDILPTNYIKELSKLQDKVPPFPYVEVKNEIQNELGKSLGEIFTSFEEKPFASASIAQVHKAKLKENTVAVKVQRPNVKEVMQEDIEIMMHIAVLLEKKSKFKRHYPTKIVEEFADWTNKELNFLKEAENAKKIKNNFKSNSIIIPKVYESYTTKKVLVLDYVEGVALKDIKKLKKKEYNIKKIIKNGFDSILTQVFIHGFFHADPHPGNIIITKEGTIALVDFGIIGKFDEGLRRNCIRLFSGIITNDAGEIEKSFLKIGSIKKGFSERAFREEIQKIIEPLQGAKIKDVKISSILEKTLRIALKYNMKMPISFILFGKTIATLEGVALEYDPNFNIVENSQPFIEKLIKKEYNLGIMTKDFVKTFAKFKKFITDFPEQTTKALKTIQDGRVKVEMKNSDIKGLSVEIDKSSNRLAYGMVIAALIVAGALVVNVNMPKLLGLPIISVLCFFFAGILGLLLIKSILAEKKIER